MNTHKMKLVIELELTHDNLDSVAEQLADFAELVRTNNSVFHNALNEDPDTVSVGGVVKDKENDRITGAFSIAPGDIKFGFTPEVIRDTPFGNINDVIEDLEKAVQQ